MKPLISSRFQALIFLPALACACCALQARTLIDFGPATATGPSSASAEKAVSARFRREFDATGLLPGERLVLLACSSDGEVIYLNGHEVGRVNMPAGPVDAKTLALAPLEEAKKGLYIRVPLPSGEVHPGGKNLIEAEVHSAAAEGARLSFDLAVKTLPADQPLPVPDAQAKQVLESFRQTSYIAPGTLIPDGYFDGGRHMVLDAQDHARSGREILLVDRPHDAELALELEHARSLRTLPPMERARRLSLYVEEMATPPGGLKVLDPTITELEHEFVNKPLLIGEVVAQSHAGVCRHRSLLFKLLADEAGLKSALVRGNYVHSRGGSGPHAWNEVQLEDGRRYLVDTMLHPRTKPPEITNASVTSPEVAKHYVKGDGTPFYGPAAR